MNYPDNLNGLSLEWISLATNWTIEPTLIKNISGGEVYEYIYNGGDLTLYRYITSDGTIDSFYESFDSVNDILDDLVTTRY